MIPSALLINEKRKYDFNETNEIRRSGELGRPNAGFMSTLRVFAINNLMKKMNSSTSIIHYAEDT